jgi:hypothetical protein|tara:strand:+ start:488 stop:1372 length:885 start_codon:yes stop_codon:yes gene_type:complete
LNLFKKKDYFVSKKHEFTLANGNRCGHCRYGSTLNTFKPLQKDGKGAQPKLLIKAIEQLDQMFELPKKWLKNLNHNTSNASGKSRQKRSERRESIIKLLKTIMKFLDIATLRIGTPGTDSQLHNITLPVLAKHAGLNQKRAERAWSDLKDAGIIIIKPVVQTNEKGEARAKAAVKWLAVDFFEAIGLGKWFKETRPKFQNYVKMTRHKASQRKKQKESKKSDQAAQKMQLKGMVSQIFSRSRSNKARTQEEREFQLQQEVEYKRQAHIQAAYMHKETGIPLAECLEYAYERIKR